MLLLLFKNASKHDASKILFFVKKYRYAGTYNNYYTQYNLQLKGLGFKIIHI